MIILNTHKFASGSKYIITYLPLVFSVWLHCRDIKNWNIILLMTAMLASDRKSEQRKGNDTKTPENRWIRIDIEGDILFMYEREIGKFGEYGTKKKETKKWIKIHTFKRKYVLS